MIRLPEQSTIECRMGIGCCIHLILEWELLIMYINFKNGLICSQTITKRNKDRPFN